MNKPFSASSEENKKPILECIKQLFTQAETVLEIGSGTGQHALYFTQQLPHLEWQASDLEDQIEGMKLWFDERQNKQILSPKVLDVSQANWPFESCMYVFTANTTHIVSWPQVQCMFAGVSKVLKKGGLFAQYGPFNYNNQYTSASNEAFDQWLKNRDAQSGIRDFEALLLLAKENGLELQADYEMPANNRILVWRRL